ncbi:hypothetical protein CPC08DRAFT_304815 [Agrocybe pediades]|nr:hypothetical protein CPC08DRAFT_304815 [Agrocybe pediades]
MTTLNEMESDPELGRLLLSNIPPNDITTLKLNTLLTELDDESSAMEAEILRLQGMIRGIEAKKAAAQYSIHRYRTILSTVRRVPDDIWHEIFYLCLPLLRGSAMHPTDTPLLLARVCSRWRRIALSSPRLWSRFYIPLLLHNGDSLPTVKPHYITEQRNSLARKRELRNQDIKTWLQRSGSCSLSISLFCPLAYNLNRVGGFCHDGDDFNIPYIQQIFDILLPSVTRWKSVELLNFGHHMLDMHSGDSNGPAAQSNPVILQPMPTLRKISLSHEMVWAMPINPWYFPFEWYHFTDIHFHFELSAKTILEILSACRMLVNFTVFLGPDDGDILSYPNDHIVLPHLRTFIMDDWCGGPTPAQHDFFKRILAPALHRFAYRTPIRASQIPTQERDGLELSPFLAGSPSLEILSIDPCTISISELLKCFSTSSNVRKIVLGHDLEFNKIIQPGPYQEEYVHILEGHFDSFDLKNLAIPPFGHSSSPIVHNGVLLPELEELVAYRLSDLTDEELLTVIKSRLDAWKDGKAGLLRRPWYRKWTTQDRFEVRRQRGGADTVFSLSWAA